MESSMSGQSVSVVVKDIFDELSEENNRLNSELVFANNCLNVLIKFKSLLIRIYDKYDKSIDFEDKRELNDLTNELNLIVDSNDNFIARYRKKFVQNVAKTKTKISRNNRLKKSSNGQNRSRDSKQSILSYEERERCFDQHIGSYKCPKSGCDKCLPKNRDLYLHLKRTHSGLSLPCNFQNCNSVFKTNYELKTHLKCHSSIPQLTDDCLTLDSEEEVEEEEYIKPIKEESKDKSNKTQSNDKKIKLITFKSKKRLKTPKASIFSNDYSKHPKASEWNELTLSYAEREKCLDPITKSYKCPKPECKRYLTTNRCLYSHLWKSHRKADIECNFENCDKWFRTNSELKQHMRVHSDYKQFQCHYENCYYRTNFKGNIKLHEKIHSNQTFECDFDKCHKVFKSWSHLKEHKFIHTNEPTFECKVDGCGQWFKTRWLLKDHKKYVHLGRVRLIKKIVCDWPGCDYSGHSAALKSHKLLHTGEKPFVCDWPECGKRFRLKANLSDHNNIHYNLKPYACHWPGCGYRCTSNGNIFKHMKNSHNNQKN